VAAHAVSHLVLAFYHFTAASAQHALAYKMKFDRTMNKTNVGASVPAAPASHWLRQLRGSGKPVDMNFTVLLYLV
jgi:hypothetical protein